MSLSHLVILGIIILVVVPPEKLPEIMRNLGRFINDLKRQTNGVFSELTEDLKKDIKLTPEDMLKRLSEKPRSPEELAKQTNHEHYENFQEHIKYDSDAEAAAAAELEKSRKNES